MATGVTGALGGNSTPLSPISPSSMSGPSVFNGGLGGGVGGLTSEIDGADSARIEAHLPASFALPGGAYRGQNDEVLPDAASGRLYHTIGPSMHANTMPHRASHGPGGLHKRSVSDFDFSYMPFAHDTYATVGGMGQQTWLRGGDAGGERDISEEFDVTMVLGDLNYR